MTFGVGIVKEASHSASAGRRDDDGNKFQFQQAVSGQRKTETLLQPKTDGAPPPPKPHAPVNQRFIARVPPKAPAAAVVQPALCSSRY